MRLAAITLIFYVVIRGIGCSQQQLVYHPWLMTAEGNFDPAYFSDINSRWMCDANNGMPADTSDGHGR